MSFRDPERQRGIMDHGNGSATYVGEAKALDILASYRFGPDLPPVESPAWDLVAEAIGEALLHERAQLPPVVLGQCEGSAGAFGWSRCATLALLCLQEPIRTYRPPDIFLCPRHGATLERAVRRWPR